MLRKDLDKTHSYNSGSHSLGCLTSYTVNLVYLSNCVYRHMYLHVSLSNEFLCSHHSSLMACHCSLPQWTFSPSIPTALQISTRFLSIFKPKFMYMCLCICVSICVYTCVHICIEVSGQFILKCHPVYLFIHVFILETVSLPIRLSWLVSECWGSLVSGHSAGVHACDDLLSFLRGFCGSIRTLCS